MTNLEIALKLREQIKEQWPFVSTILALYENNTNNQFTDRIQDMIDRLIPTNVYYYDISFNNIDLEPVLVGGALSSGNIQWLSINIVLFGSEDNPLGILK